MAFYYGLRSAQHVRAIAQAVVRILGGNHYVYCQLVETSAAETQLGTFPDAHPDKWGVGHNQHDQINLDDIQAHGKRKDFKLIQQHFGYDMRRVELIDLADDPVLSTVCCRLSYKRIPDLIPGDLYGRAQYWKAHYNRVGDGTVEHYLQSVRNCLGEEWI